MHPMLSKSMTEKFQKTNKFQIKNYFQENFKMNKGNLEYK